MNRPRLAFALVLTAAIGRAEPAPLSASSPRSPALALASVDRKLADLEGEETQNKRDLAELGGKLAAAHDRVVVRGRAFYKLTRAGLLPLGGGFDALVSHAMRVERARRSLAADIEQEGKLRGHGADLARSLERIARDRVALASQRTALDTARMAQEDESRRAQAFDRAFSVSSGGNDYVAVYSGASADDGASGGGFGAARGRLLFPVPGRAEARPARREGTGGPGLEIRASIGSPVRAVFGGHVAFADRYGPYGRLVILDHGDHYYSVSGNLAGIDVKVGDEVSAGERIGSVGDDGHGPMLYFEVRKGTETVAPGPWLGI
jgi:murein hydrolase activator